MRVNAGAQHANASGRDAAQGHWLPTAHANRRAGARARGGLPGHAFAGPTLRGRASLHGKERPGHMSHAERRGAAVSRLARFAPGSAGPASWPARFPPF
jgi:hypothetical protein